MLGAFAMSAFRPSFLSSRFLHPLIFLFPLPFLACSGPGLGALVELGHGMHTYKRLSICFDIEISFELAM